MNICVCFCYREHGQGTSDELRSRDFRKDLEDRELRAIEKDKTRRTGSGSVSSEARESSSSTTSKRPKLDQVSS